jgi:hypothetical protein
MCDLPASAMLYRAQEQQTAAEGLGGADAIAQRRKKALDVFDPQDALVVQRAEPNRLLLSAFVEPMLAVIVHVQCFDAEAITHRSVGQPGGCRLLDQLCLARAFLGVWLSLPGKPLGVHDDVVAMTAFVGGVSA